MSKILIINTLNFKFLKGYTKAERTGFEPVTSGLTNRCSAVELPIQTWPQLELN